jgi:CubicO group peptidase (beta-lactamase class C family)
MTGLLFDRPETLEIMLAPVPVAAAPPDASPHALPPGAYRVGIWSQEVAGLPSWRHSGFWGTVATYVPSLDLALAVTVNQNQARAAMQGLVEGAVEVAREQSAPAPRSAPSP